MKKILNLFIFLSLFSISSVKALEVNSLDELKSCMQEDNQTCKVMQDIILDERIRFDGVITLDLFGHEIKMADSVEIPNAMFQVVNGGKFTINDSIGTGKISTGNSGTYGCVAAYNLEDVEHENKKRTTIIVNGGTLSAKYYAVVGNGYTGIGYTDITINGGKLSGELGIYNPQTYSTLTINGGEITGETGIELRAGDLTINGGKITSTYVPTETEANGSGSTTLGTAVAISQHSTFHPINVIINGGEFNGFTPFTQHNIQKNPLEAIEKISLSITNGTFNAINNGINVIYSENFTNFVSGGNFSINLDEKYVSQQNNTNYEVVENKVLKNENVTFTNEEKMPNEYFLLVTNNDEDVDTTKTELKKLFENNKTFKDIELISLYNIDVIDEKQEVVEMIDGSYTITIELTEELLNYDTYKAIYVDDNNEITLLDATRNENSISFTTTHLSTYGIIGLNNIEVVNPQTSDNIYTYITILLLSISGLALFIRKLFI